MRPVIRVRVAYLLGLAGAALLIVPGFARCAPAAEPVAAVMPEHITVRAPAATVSFGGENDRRPIIRPPDWEPSFWGQHFRQGIVAPLSHVFDIPDKLLWAARAHEVLRAGHRRRPQADEAGNGASP